MDTEHQPPPLRLGPDAIEVAVSLFVAFNFGFAQPLLDLLGRNAELFIARDSSRTELIMLALGLTVIIPVLLAATVWAVYRIDRRIGAALHGVSFVALIAAFFVQLLERLPGLNALSGVLLIALGVACGIALVLLFHRRRWTRRVMRAAWPAALLFAGVFLFLSPVSKLLFSKQFTLATGSQSGRAPDVVMVVFDELPIATLMDRSGQIDERMWPNFARLARTSTWFRNATTVNDRTGHAVPAILDGRYTDEDELPIRGDHPDNLFTLLGRSHKINAIEPLTYLCPKELCKGDTDGEASGFGTLLSDLKVIFAHLLLPDDLTESLPRIDETWGNFGPPDEGARRRGMPRGFGGNPLPPFRQFLTSLENTTEPTVNFIHSVLPHDPFIFMPDGQQYPRLEVPSTYDGRWGYDEWHVKHWYHRHLLQTAFADRLLGRLLDRLEALGTLDLSVLVVVADHGGWWGVGEAERDATTDTMGGIAAVPMFVKRPGQTEGTIDDAPALTIDVLPTIAELVGAKIWDHVDGSSLFSEEPSRRAGRVIQSRESTIEFGIAGDEKLAAIRLKYQTFERLPSFFEVGPQRTGSLVGRPLSSLTIGAAAPGSARIENAGALESVQPNGARLPALLVGELDHEPTAPVLVAVGLNGHLAGVTRTFEAEPTQRFATMLPPHLFIAGDQEVRLFVLERRGDSVILHPLAT